MATSAFAQDSEITSPPEILPAATYAAKDVISTSASTMCAVAMVMPINLDANASEREFGVGYSGLFTTDPMSGQMQYSLWYPTKVPNSVVRLGPFEFLDTQDAEPAAGQFGLVNLSHGSGGSDLGHWDSAIALAKAGFIAAAPLHPRNNFRDEIGDDERIILDGRLCRPYHGPCSRSDRCLSSQEPRFQVFCTYSRDTALIICNNSDSMSSASLPAPRSFRISVSLSLLDGYDDPELLLFSIPTIFLIGADGAQLAPRGRRRIG